MLHIYNSLDLMALAEKLEMEIKENWKNPFVSPIVLFSDSKIEQWFKINWIKKNQKSNSVLMNLDGKRLESFLFSVIKSTDENKIEHLSCELLRDIIIQKLISVVEVSGKKKRYFETLNDSHVTQYLSKKATTDSDEDLIQVDELHLFDLAQSLSNLFYTYECTRGDEFIEAWRNGNDFFIGAEASESQKWQRKIYVDTYNDVEQLNKKFNKNYTNLPRFAYENRKKFGELKSKLPDNSGIYVFGFSGMGQAYRKVLAEIGKTNEVYVFVQAQDFGEAKEDGYKNLNNYLLNKWGLSGYENLYLWKKENCKVENIPANKKSDSLLGTIQSKICQNEPLNPSELNAKIQDKDKSICFANAATKVREIEYVHSQICNIIQEKTAAGENIEYSDFVVLAPNVDDYKVQVIQVFGQDVSKIVDEKNLDAFPRIPFVFADYSASQSYTASVLENLFSLLKKESLCRRDLFILVQNPIVQAARGFTSEDVSAWTTWVSNLNAYRDRESVPAEWKIAINRLLLSRLTENNVILEDDVIIPYSNIDSENNETLLKFANIIEELEDWICTYKDKTELSKQDVQNIRNFMDKWIKTSGILPYELSGERLVYSEISETFDYQDAVFELGNEAVNAEGFYSALCANSESSSGSNNMLYTGGITFSNFVSNRTIPAKYVFLLGLDSKAFPGIDKEDSLDLRAYENPKRNPGDEIPSAKNKDAFLCQLMATGERLFISFISKDLVKAEDFFRSSVVTNLLECIFAEYGQKDFKIPNEAVMNIDENRDWDELYTQREFRNKKNYEAMLSAKKNPKSKVVVKVKPSQDELEKSILKNLPDRVYLSSFTSFLKNPYMFQIKKVLNVNEDSDAAEKDAEFEPIGLENLQISALIKDGILAEKDLSTAVGIDRESIYNRHVLDKSDYGNISMASVEKTIEYFRKAIMENQGNVLSDFTFNEGVSFGFTQEVTVQNNTISKNWLLTGKLSGYRWNNNTDLELIDFTSAKEAGIAYGLTPYLSALYLIARKNTNDECSAKIYVYYGKGDCKEITVAPMTSKDAETLLQEMYKKAYVEKYKAMFFVNWLNTDNEKITKLQEFVTTAEAESDWRYFQKKKYISLYKDVGYTYSNFANEFKEVVDNCKALVLLSL